MRIISVDHVQLAMPALGEAVTLPDGARAKTHLHRGIETAVYIFEGEAEM